MPDWKSLKAASAQTARHQRGSHSGAVQPAPMHRLASPARGSARGWLCSFSRASIAAVAAVSLVLLVLFLQRGSNQLRSGAHPTPPKPKKVQTGYATATTISSVIHGVHPDLEGPCTIKFKQEEYFVGDPSKGFSISGPGRHWYMSDGIAYSPCNWTDARYFDGAATVFVVDPCMFWEHQLPFTLGLHESAITVVSTVENPVRCIDKLARRNQVPLVDMWAIPDFHADVFVVSPLPPITDWTFFELDRRRIRSPLDPESDDVLFLGSISNCETGRSPRLALASRMKRYAEQKALRVLVNGRCFKHKDPVSLKEQLRQKQHRLTKATFALAFENSFMPGYATEKVFDAVVAGAVPVVAGGARYSDMLPRRTGDVDGSHPVFIDAASFASPEQLVDYLLWLVKTGKIVNYRPWVSRAVEDTEVAQGEKIKPPHPESGIQWPCIDADIVRCGFGHVAPPTAWMKAAIEYKALLTLGVNVDHKNLAGWFAEHLDHVSLLEGCGDASIAPRTGEKASHLVAPWRHADADPTLAEWRAITGAPMAGVGPEEILLDLQFCACEEPDDDGAFDFKVSPHAWCVARHGSEISQFRSRKRVYWWTGAAVDDIKQNYRQVTGVECRYWEFQKAHGNDR